MAMNVTPFVGTDNFNMETFNNMISQINGGVNSEISDVLAQLGTKAKVQTGSYVGTGTYGANNPCSLTFDFAPKLVIIRLTDGSEAGIFVYNSKTYLSIGGRSGDSFGPCSQSNNTISWYYEYEDGSIEQLNAPRRTYVWVAIG